MNPPCPDPCAANDSFRDVVRAFDFRFRCVDCVHFAPVAGTCSMEFDPGWLSTPDVRLVTDAGHLVFCKHFELD